MQHMSSETILCVPTDSSRLRFLVYDLNRCQRSSIMAPGGRSGQIFEIYEIPEGAGDSD